MVRFLMGLGPSFFKTIDEKNFNGLPAQIVV